MKLIQSLSRAADIINCFDEYNHELSLNEISEITGININTTRGLINTLIYHSYIEHDKIKNLYKLGYIFIPKYNLIKERENNFILNNIEDFLESLANEYDITARFHFVKNNSLIRIFNKNPDNARYVLHIRDSKNLPLNETSSGKLILRYSDKTFLNNYKDNFLNNFLFDNSTTAIDLLEKEFKFIDDNGYSKECDEVAIGISSVAVPILNGDKLLGTISATGATETMKKEYESIVDSIKNYLIYNKNIL